MALPEPKLFSGNALLHLVPQTVPCYLDPHSGMRYYLTGTEYLRFDLWMTEGWLSHSLLHFGFYERPVFEAIKRHLRSGMVFVDVGANIGAMSIFAHRITGAPVIALEPEGRMRELCRINFAHHGMPLDWVLSKAAGKEAGIAELRWTKTPGMSSFRREEEKDAVVERVQVVSLDELFGNLPPQYAHVDPPQAIKIDVEGFEMEVIAGAEKTLRGLPKKGFVIVEAHPGPNLGCTTAMIVEQLSLLGLKCFELTELGQPGPLTGNLGAQVIAFPG